MKQQDTDQLLILVRDSYNVAKNSRNNIDDEMKEAYKQYIGKCADSEDTYFIPETYSIVQTILPRLVGPFLNRNKPIICAEGREESDHEQAETIESLLAYMFQLARADRKLKQYYLQALIFKGAVVRTYWDYKEEQKEKLNPLYSEEIYNPFGFSVSPTQTGWERVIEPTVTFDSANFDVVPIFDFYPDPDCASLNSDEPARFVIQQKSLDRSEIEDLIDSGYYDDSAQIMLDEMPEGRGEAESTKQEIIEEKGYKDAISASKSLKMKYWVLEYWTKDRVVIVGEDKYILKNDKNVHGYIPYIYMTYSELPFQLWGMSIPDVIGDLQEIANVLANERLESVKLAIHGMTFIKKGVLGKNKPNNLEAGTLYEVAEEDLGRCIKFEKYPDVSQSSYNEQQMATSQMQNATGATEYIRGENSDVLPKQTATEVNSKTLQANTRFEFIFKHMAESVLEIARHFLLMAQKYIREEKMIRIVGAKGAVSYKKIQPQDIQGEYDIILAVDPMRSDEQKHRENLLQFLQIVANPMFMNQVNPQKLLNEIMSALDIDHDVLFTTEEMQINEQAMQMQQAGIIGGGASLPEPGAGGVPEPSMPPGMGETGGAFYGSMQGTDQPFGLQ